MTKPTRPVLRYHGGKFRLAPWILQFFPAHKIYVEPYGGAASVLLQKQPAYSEVYNDLDGEIVNLFRVLQHPENSRRLFELLELTPYAREEFMLAWEKSDDPVEQARRTIIRAQMGFGSAGATKGSAGFRIDTSRRYTTAMMDWERYPQCLPPIIARLKGVQIENRPAQRVIEANDSAETLFYVDPPYLHDTRVMGGSTRYYRHEMTTADHIALLDQLLELSGMVVLNGYDSDLYNDTLRGWERHQTTSRASAHRGTGMRTEVVWLNPACSRALHGVGLFAEVTA